MGNRLHINAHGFGIAKAMALDSKSKEDVKGDERDQIGQLTHVVMLYSQLFHSVSITSYLKRVE